MSRPDEPRVLVGAYACAPPGTETFHGGEDLLGWRMVQQLDRRCDLTVLASGRHRASIEQRLEEDPLPGTDFVYVALPPALSPLRSFQGGIQLHAYLWQIQALRTARRLHRSRPFDLYHHLTYANDWMASYVGAFLDVPYVRGPGGGAQAVPPELLPRYGPRFRTAQWLRTAMQRVLRMDPVYIQSQERAARILVCTEESMEVLRPSWRDKARYFPVNGITREELVDAPDDEEGRDGFRVVTAGKLLPHKGFDLAVEAFARFAEDAPDSELVLLGDGPERGRLEALARRHGIDDRVEIRGWTPHPEVLEAIRDADVCLFPSLRDGGGSVVVEAMASATPVVCLDLAGPGLHVREDCGVKAPPGPGPRVVADLADALERLREDPALRRSMAKSAWNRARKEYLWELLGERMAGIYREVLAERGG